MVALSPLAVFLYMVIGMDDFKRVTPLQKVALDKLTDAVREYLRMVEIPKGCRHRKTTFVFIGDRFKPVGIDSHYVKPKKDCGEDGEFIKCNAAD